MKVTYFLGPPCRLSSCSEVLRRSRGISTRNFSLRKIFPRFYKYSVRSNISTLLPGLVATWWCPSTSRLSNDHVSARERERERERGRGINSHPLERPGPDLAGGRPEDQQSKGVTRWEIVKRFLIKKMQYSIEMLYGHAYEKKSTVWWETWGTGPLQPPKSGQAPFSCLRCKHKFKFWNFE